MTMTVAIFFGTNTNRVIFPQVMEWIQFKNQIATVFYYVTIYQYINNVQLHLTGVYAFYNPTFL